MPLLRRVFFMLTAAVTAALVLESQAFAGEAELVLPDLDQVAFFGNIDGRSLLMLGLVAPVSQNANAPPTGPSTHASCAKIHEPSAGALGTGPP